MRIEPSTEPADFLSELKSRTASHHAETEKASGLGALLRGDASLVEARSAFRPFAVAMLRAELALARSAEWSAFPSVADRIGARALRAALKEDDPALLDVPPLEIDYGGAFATLGGLYVIEGSAMGARSIRERLVFRFGGEADRAFPYFAALAAEATSRWPAFRAEVSRVRAAASDREIAVRKAQETFLKIGEAVRGLSREA